MGQTCCQYLYKGSKKGEKWTKKNSFTLFFLFEMFTTSLHSCNELELALILNFVRLLYCGRGYQYDGIYKVQQHYEYSIHGGLKVYNYLSPTKENLTSNVPNLISATESDMSAV